MKKENTHKNTSGFKVPEDYFERFDLTFLKKSLKENPWPKDEGYKIPKDYFETFEARLMQQLSSEKNSRTVSLTTRRKIYYTLSAVAAVFILFIGIRSFLPSSNANPYSISYTDIEVYINSGYMVLNSDDIASVYEDIALDIATMTDDTLEDEQLVEYLYENLEDYNDIMITD